MTALIVEDNAHERDLMIANLSECGIDGYEAHGTLAGAMDALRQNDYDMIVLDLKLEDSSAENTVTELPAIRQLAGGTPILLCTGNLSAILDGTRIFSQGLVRKPFTSEHFIDMARTVIFSTVSRLEKKKEAVQQ